MDVAAGQLLATDVAACEFLATGVTRRVGVGPMVATRRRDRDGLASAAAGRRPRRPSGAFGSARAAPPAGLWIVAVSRLGLRGTGGGDPKHRREKTRRSRDAAGAGGGLNKHHETRHQFVVGGRLGGERIRPGAAGGSSVTIGIVCLCRSASTKNRTIGKNGKADLIRTDPVAFVVCPCRPSCGFADETSLRRHRWPDVTGDVAFASVYNDAVRRSHHRHVDVA